MDMIVKTFLNDKGLVRTVIYELPRHEAVNKYTKMTLVEKNGYWSVVADVFPHQGLSVVPQKAKSQVPCEKTRTELYT
jgi:hypothetical protein